MLNDTGVFTSVVAFANHKLIRYIRGRNSNASNLSPHATVRTSRLFVTDDCDSRQYLPCANIDLLLLAIC